ncbi:unnamed protein product [Allacma fusca]|uniref:Uncharacterized protein n=1 Tax=Allacma fusca TaxID=39272 RepID=A0A8J2P6B5_9HEXA|nr:unnamed protein product [Allacma fusca]
MVLSTFRMYSLIAGISATILVGIIIGIKIIRRRREARRQRRLRKPRNSLQKYPSFVANRITGVITILPHEYRDKYGSTLMGQQYIIAVTPPIDFYMSNLSYYDRLYPGRAVRQTETTKDSGRDENNNVLFYNEDDENNNDFSKPKNNRTK